MTGVCFVWCSLTPPPICGCGMSRENSVSMLEISGRRAGEGVVSTSHCPTSAPTHTSRHPSCDSLLQGHLAQGEFARS